MTVVSSRDFLLARARRTSFHTKEDVIRFTVRASIAELGPQTGSNIEPVVFGLTVGIFDEAWDRADLEQRMKWLDMVLHEYLKATGQ